MLHSVPTYVLPAVFTAVALPSFVLRFPIAQTFQLRNYSDIPQHTVN